MQAPSSAVTGLTTSGAHPWPSPLTEFCNNGTSACAPPAERRHRRHRLSFLQRQPMRTVGGVRNAAGNGCILSYNVSNPARSRHSGTGLNVTTPGTNGCWATGGIVLDNSATTAGASQIYFVNLNGGGCWWCLGGTQTSTNCAAGAGPTIQATQASQSSP